PGQVIGVAEPEPSSLLEVVHGQEPGFVARAPAKHAGGIGRLEIHVVDSEEMKLNGLHHVTAITARARQNVDFYTNVLGLRLVKKTVNQDDVSAYHLFYGDEIGRPGTEVTFFDWPMAGQARPGYPSIAPIALAVPSADSVSWWQGRFQELGVENDEPSEVEGRLTLGFRDPEGQRLELVDAEGQETPGRPWDAGPVPAEHTIRGLHHVTLTVGRVEPSERFVHEVMGIGADAVRLRQ